MSVLQAAEAEKVARLQELEAIAGNYCKKLLDLIFENDIKSKGSEDPTPARHAHLYKNNMLYVLERVMSFSSDTGTTRDPIDFMREYDKRHEGIMANYKAVIDEESAKAREDVRPVRPRRTISNYFPKGGRRRTLRKKF